MLSTILLAAAALFVGAAIGMLFMALWIAAKCGDEGREPMNLPENFTPGPAQEKWEQIRRHARPGAEHLIAAGADAMRGELVARCQKAEAGWKDALGMCADEKRLRLKAEAALSALGEYADDGDEKLRRAEAALAEVRGSMTIAYRLWLQHHYAEIGDLLEPHSTDVARHDTKVTA